MESFSYINLLSLSNINESINLSPLYIVRCFEDGFIICPPIKILFSSIELQAANNIKTRYICFINFLNLKLKKIVEIIILLNLKINYAIS